jgi:hypothetical protein
MKRRAGPFVIEIPESWADRSQIVFVDAGKGNEGRAATVKKAPSISLTLTAHPGSIGVAAILAASLAELTAADPDLSVQGQKEDRQAGRAHAWVAMRNPHPAEVGIWVRAVGERIIKAVGQTPPALFAENRAAFERAATSATET